MYRDSFLAFVGDVAFRLLQGLIPYYANHLPRPKRDLNEVARCQRQVFRHGVVVSASQRQW